MNEVVLDQNNEMDSWYLIKTMIMEVLVQVLERLQPRSLLVAVLVCPLWLHLAEQASCQVDIVKIQTDRLFKFTSNDLNFI